MINDNYFREMGTLETNKTYLIFGELANVKLVIFFSFLSWRHAKNMIVVFLLRRKENINSYLMTLYLN